MCEHAISHAISEAQLHAKLAIRKYGALAKIVRRPYIDWNEVKRLIQATLAKLGYRVQGIRYCPRQLLDAKNLRVVEFDDVVCRRMFESGSQFTFIQVGAFDGVTKDPLQKYINRCGWRGVLIEPQADGGRQTTRSLQR